MVQSDIAGQTVLGDVAGLSGRGKDGGQTERGDTGASKDQGETGRKEELKGCRLEGSRRPGSLRQNQSDDEPR